MAGPWKKPLWGGPLTLEKYHRFFVDPWGASITNDQLNHVRAHQISLSTALIHSSDTF
jgi:hypothetical protein